MFVVAYEHFTNKAATLNADWIQGSNINEGKAVFSFFHKDINKKRDISFKTENYKGKISTFDGKKSGIFKFHIVKRFGEF
jgi:hypothetical protein